MKEGKITIWLLSLWVVAGFLIVLLARPLHDALWIMAPAVFYLWLLIGVILAGISAIHGFKRRDNTAKIAAAGFVCFGLIVIFQGSYISAIGQDLVINYRLNSHISQYEQVIADAKAGHLTDGYGEGHGVRYHIDEGPPLRVAFPQPGGFLDNWEGIIYDPTGQVLKAQGRTGPDKLLSAPSEIVELFGGNLVSCTPLSGHYYRCVFT